jgi:acylglycerol lipase
MTQGAASTTEQDGTFKTADGLKIFYRVWRPAGTPRGVVVIVPGFNAHSAYYAWTADQFVKDDLAAYALDLRGRGSSRDGSASTSTTSGTTSPPTKR